MILQIDMEAQTNDLEFNLKSGSEAKVHPDDFQILLLVQMELTVFNSTGIFFFMINETSKPFHVKEEEVVAHVAQRYASGNCAH